MPSFIAAFDGLLLNENAANFPPAERRDTFAVCRPWEPREVCENAVR